MTHKFNISNRFELLPRCFITYLLLQMKLFNLFNCGNNNVTTSNLFNSNNSSCFYRYKTDCLLPLLKPAPVKPVLIYIC